MEEPMKRKEGGGILTIPAVIPIKIHPFFWLVAALIALLNAPSLLIGLTIWIPIIFFSILFHEYGHALTARLFGQQAVIELVGFGGLTQRSGKKVKIWQDFIIVLNGPLAGLALAFFAYFLYQKMALTAHPIFLYICSVVYSINLLWTVFNVLPIYPLDGGHLLRYFLQGIFGLRGVKIAFFLSLLFASALCAFFFIYNQLFMGSILLLFAFESFRAFRSSLRLSSEDNDASLQEKLIEGENFLQQGYVDEAKDSFEKLLSQTKKGIIHIEATELLAQIYFNENNFSKAYELLKPHISQVTVIGKVHAQIAAYQCHLYDEALAIGKKIWPEDPSHQTACYNAFSHAAKGETDKAIGWLANIAQDDASKVSPLLQRPEFNPIRNTPLFQKFAAQFS